MAGSWGWPTGEPELLATQRQLADAAVGALQDEPLGPPAGGTTVGACFVAFARGHAGSGAAGDPCWAGAVIWSPPTAEPTARRSDRHLVGRAPAGAARQADDVEGQAVVVGRTTAAYIPGLLALREGPLLERAVRSLTTFPDVLLVDATGLDHPRGAGLALHLGAVLDVPTVGVTHRALLASGEWPDGERGARAPLSLAGRLVGYWVRTATGRRPLAVHAGWRTTPDVAIEVVLACSTEAARTPVPLQEARRVAREARHVVPAPLV